MAEAVTNRTIITLDGGAIDARVERIGLACRKIMASANEAISKMRNDADELTSDVQVVIPHPPAPRGSQQVPPPPPTPPPTAAQMQVIKSQAETLLAVSGGVAADFRFWVEEWSKAKKLHLREAWCQIMRLVRSIGEIAERFIACVVPFWEYLPNRNRYIEGFMDTFEATVMPYLEEVVNVWGQWAHITTRNHVEGCVGVDCCALFAPPYMMRDRRAVVLPAVVSYDT